MLQTSGRKYLHFLIFRPEVSAEIRFAQLRPESPQPSSSRRADWEYRAGVVAACFLFRFLITGASLDVQELSYRNVE
jgi:hypothetical protein